MKLMRILGNCIWFLFGGAITGLLWTIAGLGWCLTILGIPVGKQCFKIARLCFFPFGKTVVYDNRTTSFLLNLLWISCSGLVLATEATAIGLVFCLTIVGIPFGKQYFKIAHLALTPFGAEII